MVTVLTVLTKSNCNPCVFTKRLLERNGKDFVERNIETDPEAMELAKSLGYLQAPVVITPDGDSWSGLNPDKINAL